MINLAYLYMNSILISYIIAEQQLMETELNEENTLSVLSIIMDEKASDIVRISAAAFLKTSLSKIYNVSKIFSHHFRPLIQNSALGRQIEMIMH